MSLSQLTSRACHASGLNAKRPQRWVHTSLREAVGTETMSEANGGRGRARPNRTIEPEGQSAASFQNMPVKTTSKESK